MSTARRALLLSALFTLVPVGIGVAVSDDPSPERAAPDYVGTDLADYDTAAAVVQRAPFCELIPDAAAEAALGTDADVTTYGNGEKSEALPGGDVSHEYGCLFSGAGTTEGDGTSAAIGARGWVFAPPVTPERAAQLAKAAAGKGCVVQPDAPAYGTPSVALLCTQGELRTASYRGLFGDAWLACSLTLRPGDATDAELTERVGRWCVAVAEAAAAPMS